VGALSDRDLSVDDYVTAAARGLSRAMVEIAARDLPEQEREELRGRLDALTGAPPTVPMRLPAAAPTVALDLPQPVAPLVLRDAAGRVTVEWPEGRAATVVAPEMVEGWAGTVNGLLDETDRLKQLFAEALDGWGNQGDYGDDPYDTITRIRREAALP
jgi:hypothetical protein